MSEEIRNLEQRKEKLLQAIEGTKQKKERVILIVQELVRDLQSGRLTRRRYEEKLRQALEGRSAEQWIKYYDEYLDYYNYQIKLAEKLIRESWKKRVQIKKVPQVDEKRKVYGGFDEKPIRERKKIKAIPVLTSLIVMVFIGLMIFLMFSFGPVGVEFFKGLGEEKVSMDLSIIQDINKQEFIEHFMVIVEGSEEFEEFGFDTFGLAERYYGAFMEGLVGPEDPLIGHDYEAFNQIVNSGIEVFVEDLGEELEEDLGEELEEDLTRGDKQYQAVLNQPVNWEREISDDEVTTLLPRGSKIKVVRGEDKEITDDVNVNIKLFSRNLELDLEGYNNYKIIYETPAPEIKEKGLRNGKQIVISSPKNIHYSEILSFTKLSNELDEEGLKKIRFYQVVDGKRNKIPFTPYDTNENGLYDTIEWITPQLSEATFELIEINKALHLDSEKEFISDIFESVSLKDDNWSEAISENEYVRITFEKELDNTKDITIYPRIVSGNPSIEVYEEDSDLKIAEFESLNENEYNKIYLTELEGLKDTFDLKIVNGAVEFDHIIDPDYPLEGYKVYGCGYIQAPGYYWLNQSLISNETCITINSSDVVFDMRGNSISANFTDDWSCVFHNGVTASGGAATKNVTIMNGEVKDYFTGIRLGGLNDSNVVNMSFNLNGERELWTATSFSSVSVTGFRNHLENLTFSDYNYGAALLYGSFIYLGGENNTVKNVLIKDINLTSFVNFSDPFYRSSYSMVFLSLFLTSGNIIENVTVINFNTINMSSAVVKFYNAQDNVFKDVPLDKLNGSVISSWYSEDNTFVNSTLGSSWIYFDSNSNIDFAWYFQTNVKDGDGVDVSGATVSVFDNDGKLSEELITDNNGKTPVSYLRDYRQDKFTKEYYSNYSIFAIEGIRSGQISLNMSNNRLDTLIFIHEDLTAPIVSDFEIIELGHDSAVLSWKTDEPASSKVSYGKLELSSEVYSNQFVKKHEVELIGLDVNSLYYYGIESCDSVGNCYLLDFNTNNNFTTFSETDVARCRELGLSGKTYKLVQNLSYENKGEFCIEVTAPNIVFDCNGYAIKLGIEASGIFSNQINTTLKNCNLFSEGYALSNNYGFKSYYTSYAKVINSSFGSNFYYAIDLNNSDYYEIRDSSFNDPYYSIRSYYGDYGTVKNTEFNEGTYGYYGYYGNNNVFSNISMTGIGWGFRNYYSHNTFLNDSIFIEGYQGIQVQSSYGGTFKDLLFINYSEPVEFSAIGSISYCNNVFENIIDQYGRRVGYFTSAVTLENEEFLSLYLCDADGSYLNNVSTPAGLSGPEIKSFYTGSSSFFNMNSNRAYGLYFYASHSNVIRNFTSTGGSYSIYSSLSNNNKFYDLILNKSTYSIYSHNGNSDYYNYYYGVSGNSRYGMSVLGRGKTYLENGSVMGSIFNLRSTNYNNYGDGYIYFRNFKFNETAPIELRSYETSSNDPNLFIEFLNVTGDPSDNSLILITDNVQLDKKWYYQADVYDGANPVEGAEVYLTSTQTPNKDFMVSTDSNGKSNVGAITEYVNEDGIRKYYSDYFVYTEKGTDIETHNLNVSETYDSSGTGYDFDEITSSFELKIHFKNLK